MSLDLPLLPTRYSDQWPTYDLSGLLMNGVTAFAPDSVGATVEANSISWDIRVQTSAILDSSNRRFMEGVPAELMPASSAVRLALHGTDGAQVQWSAAWGFLQLYGVNLNARGTLAFEARTRRRPA